MSFIRIDSEATSYVLDQSSNGIPREIYWGSILSENFDLKNLTLAHKRPVLQAGLDEPYEMNLLPEQGTGFRGKPGIIGHRDRKDWATHFKIKQTIQNENHVQIYLSDDMAHLELILEFIMDQTSGVLARRSCLKNGSSTPYQLHHCASGAIEIPGFCEELLTFHGCWTGEFMIQRENFSKGIKLFENQTGRTSHEAFPAMIAGSRGFDETSGTVFGCHLGWSGNYTIFAEVIPDGLRQIQMGEYLFPSEIVLGKGEHYNTPWIYSVTSNQGLNGLSDSFHTFLRNNILPESIKNKQRPVQFNSWEAVYFDHDLDKLKSLASKAADLGIERFVLDDGWFHGRDDDTKALGDWWPDSKKYPNGLSPLIDHIESLGLKFGLWVEPEMTNPDSDLFKNHPDWVLNVEGHVNKTARNQLVLNLSMDAVFDYLYEKLDDLLSHNSIDYLKWDMNRVLTTAGHKGKAVIHEQTKALYSLIERIRNKYPSVEIETCASGGGRVDYEILRYTHRFWTSDSNDPLQRHRIQKGSSIFFPPEITGSHVGPAECHTSGRKTSLVFRALSSLFYHFGCEMDLLDLTLDEENTLKQYIEIHKNHRELFHHGTYVRVNFDNSQRNGYGSISKDLSTALFCIVQMETPGHNDNKIIRFCGLSKENLYRIRLLTPVDQSIENKLENATLWFNGYHLTGQVLMESGISIFMPWPQTGVLIELIRIDNLKSQG